MDYYEPNAEIVKAIVDYLLHTLALLFNNVMEKEIFQHSFKSGKINPLFKRVTIWILKTIVQFA